MRQCQLCQKSAQKVNKRKKTRSQYNPVNTYFQQPNLQWFKPTQGERVKVCSSCRRGLLKGKLKLN